MNRRSWPGNASPARGRKSATRLEERLARRRFARAGFLDALDAAVADDRAEGSYPPLYGELWNLFQHVRARRPRLLVEFGSGYSTLALAEAVRRNAIPGSRFLSIEGIPAYADRSRAMLTEDHLEYCEVVVREVTASTYDGHDVCVHAGVSDLAPEMVYLDGPMLKHAPSWEGAVDLLQMEEKLPPNFFLIVDGRERNTRLLYENFRRPFDYWEERGLFDRAFRQRCFQFRP